MSDELVEKETSSGALYAGDRGTECFEVRQLVIFLLKGPYLLREQKKQMWRSLQNHVEEVKVQLANLFLELFISESDGIAFVRPADTGDLEVPQLLPTYTYRFLDSVLLIFMREQLLHAEQRAEQALVTDEDMITYMRMFDPSLRNDEVLLRRKLDAIQKRFMMRHLITKVEGMDGYVISPILKYVFDAGDLKTLRENYAKKAKELEKSFAFTGQNNLFVEVEDNNNTKGQQEE